MITCPSCATANVPDARFCISCGAPLTTASASQPGNPMAAPDARMPPATPGAAYVQPPAPAAYPPYPGSPPAYPGYPPPYAAYAPRPPKDRGIAFLLEILPGLFGLYGFGWMYSGNLTAGLFWLIGGLVWDVIAIGIDVATLGAGCAINIPVNIILVVLSTLFLNAHNKQHRELFG